MKAPETTGTSADHENEYDGSRVRRTKVAATMIQDSQIQLVWVQAKPPAPSSNPLPQPPIGPVSRPVMQPTGRFLFDVLFDSTEATVAGLDRSLRTSRARLDCSRSSELTNSASNVLPPVSPYAGGSATVIRLSSTSPVPIPDSAKIAAYRR
ncbi:hypothetical protein BDM02DRAFT_3128027 [Thelephora ganbajun]|uniref:Uncharacterized protein n=1 Tax=Thelephora ganbajun TaxID=370292 RepID=A0ACB6ZKH2_THEGA|nr:hypothetical protein BDM02DRAFT_3128027 [Thelephora ganbajun]